ncbi:hypothetical protein [Paenibacillus sp. GCM10028914]|uniref:hypothetical protein n=1 Tax=Paenibacillus sp. GCM10028914 TaxID=3273416 RepID=UPI003618A7FA
MKNELSDTPIWVLILAAVLVILQGSWLFINARRRGLGKMAWFWGIWGSTTMPLPLLLYWLIVIRPSGHKSESK